MTNADCYFGTRDASPEVLFRLRRRGPLKGQGVINVSEYTGELNPNYATPRLCSLFGVLA